MGQFKQTINTQKQNILNITNNVNAIISKSKIYSDREEPDYETAINIIEEE